MFLGTKRVAVQSSVLVGRGGEVRLVDRSLSSSSDVRATSLGPTRDATVEPEGCQTRKVGEK